jgi:hypothetical protein
MALRKGLVKKAAIVFSLGLPIVVVASILALHAPGHDRQRTSTTLAIVGYTLQEGHQVATFELRVPPDRRVTVERGEIVMDWGNIFHYGPPEWTKGSDPSGKSFGPGTQTRLSIIEPAERLRRLRLETMEQAVGRRVWPWKLKLFWQTKKLSALKILPAPGFVYVKSGPMSPYTSERDGAANRSQPIRPETNTTSSAVGSGGWPLRYP